MTCIHAAESLAHAFLLSGDLVKENGEMSSEQYQSIVEGIVESLEGFYRQTGRPQFSGHYHDITNLKNLTPDRFQSIASYVKDLQHDMLSEGLLGLIDCRLVEQRDWIKEATGGRHQAG